MDDVLTWLISSVGSITTTHYLLSTSRASHNSTLLLLHIAAALLLRGLRNISSGFQAREASGPWLLQRPGVSIGILECLRVITTVGTLMCAYKCFEVVENVATLVMVLTLEWQPGRNANRDINDGWQSVSNKLEFVIRSTLLTCGFVLIILKDYRLHTSADIKYILGAAGLAAFVRCLEDHSKAETTAVAAKGIDKSTVILLLAASASLTESVLSASAGPSFFSLSPTTTVLNIVLSAFALEVGCYPFKRLQASGEGPQSTRATLVWRTILSGILVIDVLVTSSVLGFPYVVSAWQYIGYFVAAAAFLCHADVLELVSAVQMGYSRLKSSNIDSHDEAEVDLLDATELEAAAQNDAWLSEMDCCPSRMETTDAIASLLPLMAGLIIWISVSIVKSTSLTTSEPIPQSSVDRNLTLDLAINRYQETAEVVAASVNALITLPRIADLQPRIFVYNKNEGLNDSMWLDELALLLPPGQNVSMYPLLNVGREAEAYFHHILVNFDGLANHTLFMQAELTDLESTRHRLDQYFRPNTGFLSLSYVGNICRDCNACQDTGGWNEDSEVLRSIFGAANEGAECKDLVLTYQGQFVVSASRIRSNDRRMYADLRQNLISGSSEKHKSPYLDQPWIGDHNDTLNAPAFGYTVERMWGVMMRCAESKIAYECPSLVAGVMGNVGRLESC